MARQLRTALPDGIFHVTTLGVDKTDIFRDDLDRVGFLALLGQCVDQFDWLVHVFCLMTTHYHCVLETTVEGMWRGLHRLNGVYALSFNNRHGRTGHLFGDRYSSRVVEDDEHLENVCNYVLDNPIRAGLCTRREEWPWAGLRPKTEHLFVRS
jgi:putative transposase